MDKVQFLYNGLFSEGTYTKSLDEFRTQMQDENYRKRLYKGLYATKDYTKSFADFEQSYGPSTVNKTKSLQTDNPAKYTPTDNSKKYYKEGVGWVGLDQVVDEYNESRKKKFKNPDFGIKYNRVNGEIVVDNASIEPFGYAAASTPYFIENFAKESGYTTPNMQKDISQYHTDKIYWEKREKAGGSTRKDYQLINGDWYFVSTDKKNKNYGKKIKLPQKSDVRKVLERESKAQGILKNMSDDPNMKYVKEGNAYKPISKSTYDNIQLEGNPFNDPRGVEHFIGYLKLRMPNDPNLPGEGSSWGELKTYLGEKKINQFVSDYWWGKYKKDGKEILTAKDGYSGFYESHLEADIFKKDRYDIRGSSNTDKSGNKRISSSEQRNILGSNYDKVEHYLDVNRIKEGDDGFENRVDYQALKSKGKYYIQRVVYNKHGSILHGESTRREVSKLEYDSVKKMEKNKLGKNAYIYKGSYTSAHKGLHESGIKTLRRDKSKYKALSSYSKAFGAHGKFKSYEQQVINGVAYRSGGYYKDPDDGKSYRIEGYYYTSDHKNYDPDDPNAPAQRNDIKNFTRAKFVLDWDQAITDELSSGLTKEDRKLLKKNPHLYITNKNYRAADKVAEEDKVLNLDDEKLLKEHEDSKAEHTTRVLALQPDVIGNKMDYKGATYTDVPFWWFDDVIAGEKETRPSYLPGGELMPEVQSREFGGGQFVPQRYKITTDIYKDKHGKKYYLYDHDKDDKTPGHKVYIDWVHGTPQSIIDEYNEIKKGLQSASEELRDSYQTYGSKSDPFVNKFNDKAEFEKWKNNSWRKVAILSNGRINPNPNSYSTYVWVKKDEYDTWRKANQSPEKEIEDIVYNVQGKVHSRRKIKVPGGTNYNAKYTGRIRRGEKGLHAAWRNTGKYKKMAKAHEGRLDNLRKEKNEYKKRALKFLDEKYWKYHYDSYEPTVQTYQEDNNIDWADDFNLKVKEAQADAQIYFEEEATPIFNEIAEEVNSDFKQRFVMNADNKIVDNLTNKIVTQKQIEKIFDKEVQNRSAKHPEIIKIKEQNNALFNNTIKEYADNWRPKRETIPQIYYDEVDDQLKALNFGDLKPAQKEDVMHNVWAKVSKQLALDHVDKDGDLGDYMNQAKHEFFNYFYDPSEVNLAFTRDGNFSAYAMYEYSADIVKSIENRLSDPSVSLDYQDRSNLELARDVVKDLDLEEKDVDEFTEGWNSTSTIEKIPYYAGFYHLEKANHAKQIADKLNNGGWESLSEEEKAYLTLQQMSAHTNQRVKDMSGWFYGAGKLTADMVPYVAEFILTSPAYAAGRAAMKTSLTKALLPKTMYTTGQLVRTRRAIDAASFLAGTLAQTAVNPHHYAEATIRNMTPTMKLALSEDGEKIITEIDEQGMDFGEAFLKGFGVTWAEFATERMGMAIPMLGKHLKGSKFITPEVKDLMKAVCLQRYMSKKGWNKMEAIAHFGKQKMGWDGFMGEIFEETINQPISNLITGEDLFSGMDERFFGELSISMGVSQLAFGGLQVGGALIAGRNKPTAYFINHKRYTQEEFLKEYERLENSGRLNNPDFKYNFKINNDALTTLALKESLKKYEGKNNTLIEQEYNVRDRVTASEIEIEDQMNETQSLEMQRIEAEQEVYLNEKDRISKDNTLSEKEKKDLLKPINLSIKQLNNAKLRITNPIRNKIEKAKRTKLYLETNANVQSMITKMGLDVEIKERATTKGVIAETKKDLKRQIREVKNAMKDLDANSSEYKNLNKTLTELDVDLNGEIKKDGTRGDSQLMTDLESGGVHGYISKDGKSIFINRQASLSKEGGNINVAAHEFLHRLLKNTMNQNPATRLALGNALNKYVQSLDPNQFANSEYRRRLQEYHNRDTKNQLGILGAQYQALMQEGKEKEAQEVAKQYYEVEERLNSNQAEEALALLSDAFASGDINMSTSRLNGLQRIIQRVLRAFGVRATFGKPEDVFDFIAEYNKSAAKGKVSRGLRRTLEKGAKIKGQLKEDVAGYEGAIEAARGEDVKKIKKSKKAGYGLNRADIIPIANTQYSRAEGKNEQELGRAANTPAIIKKNEELQKEILRRAKLDVNDPLYTGKDKNGKIIIPEDIREKLVDNNLPRVTALAAQAANAGKNIELEQDKKKGFNEFFPEYYMKLYDLTRTYNPLVWNEKNKRFDEVPFGAYMNTILPLKYSGILKDLKKGEIEGAVSTSEATGIATEDTRTPEEIGKLIKLYKRFGDMGKVYNLKVKLAISKGEFDPAKENISRIGVNTIDLFPQTTQLMFGVIPKEGNLTKGDLLESQMFTNKHVETIISMFPQTSHVVVKINEKTGKPSEIKSIGIPRKILKAFYNKGKRIGNDYIWTLKPDITTKDVLEFAGITERGKPNLYKKDTNTSQNHKALHDIIGRMMTNQASREYFLENNMPLENMGTLMESMGTNMFSRAVNKASKKDKMIFFPGLPKFAENYMKHGKNVKKALFLTYPSELFGDQQDQVIKDIERYIELYGEYLVDTALMKTPVLTLENYINEETMKLSLEKNLSDVIGVDLTGAFRNKKKLEDARNAVALIVSEGYISVEEAERFLKFLAATGNVGGTTLAPNEKGDLVYNKQHWQYKIDKAQGELNTAEKNNNKKRIKELKDRIQRYRKNLEEGSIIESKMYGLFKGMDDLKTVVTKGVKETGQKIPPNTPQHVGVKLATKEDVQAQEDSSERNKAFLRKFGKGLRELNKKKGKKGISKTSMGMILNALGNVGMGTPIAAAAKVAYTTDVSGKTISAKTHRYEHLIPRKVVTLYYANSIMEGSTESLLEFNNLLDQFVVAIIPKEQDTIVNNAGYRDSMPNSWIIGMDPLQRYFNIRTFGKINLDLIDVKTKEPITKYQSFKDVFDIVGEDYKKSMMFNKALMKGLTVQPSRGMSTFDFDETLIDKGENFIIATDPATGDQVKITSANWPLEGPNFAAQGYEFDFTDFVNVRGGVRGPLFKKLQNQIKKYGPENVYVLTARPAESASAIYEWLKANGVELPLENITGLGNSTGEAKAEWMLEKFAEGYNDMYFVDDALPNVKAVKNVLDQLDIKSNVQQARYNFSRGMKGEFKGIIENAELDINRILEQTKGVKAEARFSEAQAKIRGRQKWKIRFWIPPSAEDFKGLLYHFLARGRVGEAQMAFFEKALIKPFASAISQINTFKQNLSDKYRSLLKNFKDVKKLLNKNIEGTNYTYDQAVRVYLWNKAGFEIPGLSKRDLKTLTETVAKNERLRNFADTLGILTEREEGYLEPDEFWTVETIKSDIDKIGTEVGRAELLAEWKQNIENVFGVWENGRLVGPNMNKIEAVYGSKFRDALEDMIWAMEFGTKREQGTNKLVNAFNNWANQSVGAIMFFNMRSALLQTISSVNYVNWSDNNPLMAAAAFANQPQFWKDFSYIFNSDMLRQRRAGQQRGINEAELMEAIKGSKNPAKSALSWLLTKGFLPTQIADSFAIASGGATFYRNRVNSYIKQGLSEKEAQEKAWIDFQEITEEAQQSSRPDLLSQQQRSPLGRYILAFKNTPMQYARLMKKAFLDLINNRGDAKTNVSKIIYYGAVQNFIFSAMQSALFAIIGDDDEKEVTNRYERTANSMIDSILGGIGIGGNAVMTVKNAIQEYMKQEEKGPWKADHTYTILKLISFSPTVGSKLRKAYSAIQEKKFNEDIIGETKFIDDPRISIVGNLVSGAFNVPLDRLIRKTNNVEVAITEDLANWQRLALLMGWSPWDLDIEEQDIIEVEERVKEEKKIKKKKEEKIKKDKKKLEEEEENLKKEKENIKKQKKEKEEGKKVLCAAISRKGDRCKKEVLPGKSYCTIHDKVEKRTDGKKKQCKKIKSNKERCKMKTSSKSGLCYYHD